MRLVTLATPSGPRAAVRFGEKYLDTIYNPAWVERVIAPERKLPAPPYALVVAE